MRLLAGERKSDRKAEYLRDLKNDRNALNLYKRLYKKYPYNREVLAEIIQLQSAIIKKTMKNLIELGRLKDDK